MEKTAPKYLDDYLIKEDKGKIIRKTAGNDDWDMHVAGFKKKDNLRLTEEDGGRKPEVVKP